MSNFVRNDGGRARAGFKGSASGDCVTRAIATAAGLPYEEVYNALNLAAEGERPRSGKRRSNARTGVLRRTYEPYLLGLGFRWVSTMAIGQGCKVHLRASELPAGRLVVRVSRHLCAVIDGVVHDTTDPSRGGKRCVYGYYVRQAQATSDT